MRRVFVDYNHTGWGRSFYTELFRWERDGLHAGDVVLVGGDSIPERPARVIAVDELGVELEYVNSEEPPLGRPCRTST